MLIQFPSKFFEMSGPKCFFDISIGGKEGRIII